MSGLFPLLAEFICGQGSFFIATRGLQMCPSPPRNSEDAPPGQKPLCFYRSENACSHRTSQGLVYKVKFEGPASSNVLTCSGRGPGGQVTQLPEGAPRPPRAAWPGTRPTSTDKDKGRDRGEQVGACDPRGETATSGTVPHVRGRAPRRPCPSWQGPPSRGRERV